MTQPSIAVSGHHHPLALFLYFTQLTVEVDGEAHAGRWRRRAIDVSPGSHSVKVFFKYFSNGRCAEASVHVDVPADGAVALKYAAPYLMTMPGTLTQDQPRSAG